jgi:hypothetical protein
MPCVAGHGLIIETKFFLRGMEMTQYQQVLDALKALGGKGTSKQIYEKIVKTTGKEWGAVNPIKSVWVYLSNNGCKHDGRLWTLESAAAENEENVSAIATQGRGLYFITLGPYVKIPGAGFIFKIGQSADMRDRVRKYSATLPFDTIQMISHYPVPDDIDLNEVETSVRGEIVGNDNLGEGYFDFPIKARTYFSNHQEEWLQILDLPETKDAIDKLASIIDSVVTRTIDDLLEKVKLE